MTEMMALRCGTDEPGDEPGRFWQALDALVASSAVVVDRPRGSGHPRYPDFIYPLDYGYLAGTLSADGGGIDVWVGSLPERKVTAVICSVDLVKRDSEVKLLLGCTAHEAQTILAVHNADSQSAICVLRPVGPAAAE
jgi:inorganic pyrophosphatase